MIAGVVLLAIGATYLWASRAPTLPSASVKLVGYETRKGSLVATVVLANTGRSALSYYDSSEGVYYTVLARVQGKATNWHSGGGPLSMSGPIVVWPSRSARIHVVLPDGTETWRCTVLIRGTGARVRVFEHLGKWGIWDRAFPFLQWFIGLFPMNDSEERQIQSDTFAIPANTLR